MTWTFLLLSINDHWQLIFDVSIEPWEQYCKENISLTILVYNMIFLWKLSYWHRWAWTKIDGFPGVLMLFLRYWFMAILWPLLCWKTSMVIWHWSGLYISSTLTSRAVRKSGISDVGKSSLNKFSLFSNKRRQWAAWFWAVHVNLQYCWGLEDFRASKDVALEWKSETKFLSTSWKVGSSISFWQQL